jgi:hypothetical protein
MKGTKYEVPHCERVCVSVSVDFQGLKEIKKTKVFFQILEFESRNFYRLN